MRLSIVRDDDALTSGAGAEGLVLVTQRATRVREYCVLKETRCGWLPAAAGKRQALSTNGRDRTLGAERPRGDPRVDHGNHGLGTSERSELPLYASRPGACKRCTIRAPQVSLQRAGRQTGGKAGQGRAAAGGQGYSRRQKGPGANEWANFFAFVRRSRSSGVYTAACFDFSERPSS